MAREAADRIAFVVELYRICHGNFKMKRFHEVLRAEHSFKPSCRLVKAVLQSRGLVPIAAKR